VPAKPRLRGPSPIRPGDRPFTSRPIFSTSLFAEGFVPPFLPAAARQNAVVLDVIVDAMVGYAKGGYDVIVDGIVGPWSLPQFAKGAAGAGLELAFVVLRPSFEETLARAVAREAKELKATGPIR